MEFNQEIFKNKLLHLANTTLSTGKKSGKSVPLQAQGAQRVPGS